MMKVPSGLFVAGLELIAKGLRDLQQLFERSVDGVLTEDSGNGQDRHVDPQPQHSGNGSEKISSLTNMNEKELTMADQDLGGDDLKVVNYSIFFTKRDLETTLQPNQQDVVDYATDGASFGATKILDLSDSSIPYPAKWSDNKYPGDFHYNNPHADKIPFNAIPKTDRRYLSFLFEVIDRVPRQNADYDKRKTRSIESIETTLGEISGKIGP